MMRHAVSGIVCVMMAAGFAAGENPRSVGERRMVREPVEMNALRMPQPEDRDALGWEREALFARLTAGQVPAGIERPLTVRLTPRELAEIGDAACEGCTAEPSRLRVGLAKDVAAEMSKRGFTWGASQPTADGGFVWSAAVRSVGAYGLRLHLTDFDLPVDSQLYLYNERGDVVGPYEGRGPLDSGDFWTHLVRGDTVYLQVRRFGAADGGSAGQIPKLQAVGHVGLARGSTIDQGKAFCDFNARCIINMSCADAPAAIELSRDAVAHMLFVDGSYLYACSGALLNNTASDGAPYFLTANHCLRTDEVAATLETFFAWSVPCGASCPDQWSDPVDVPTVLGARVVATNWVGDYSLLRLSGATAPAGTALLGWTSKPVAFADGAPLYRISHPAGAPQAFSQHVVDVDARTCLLWPRGSSIYSRNVVGAIEGGSSGSPVLNAEGQVVGQLTGSCGFLAWLPCLGGLHATVDGAFASYFDEVMPWLAPPGGCSDDMDGDEYVARDCGGFDCDDGDFLVNPTAPEVCDNGRDDDCDGSIDDADPDCGVCLPEGERCTSGSECCSGRCRWLLRTCR
jgi:hypothetical protein